MTFRRFMKSGYTKGLVALLLAQQLSACGGGSSSTPVTITVGDATVTMSAPTQRENDVELDVSELGGFRVYYGSASGDYQREVDIPGSADIASVTVTDLPQGDYFFVVTAYDTEGRESLYSSEVKITI